MAYSKKNKSGEGVWVTTYTYFSTLVMIEIGTVSRVGRNKEKLVVIQHQRTSFLIKKLIFLEIIFLMGNFKYCFPNIMNKMTNLKVSSISCMSKEFRYPQYSAVQWLPEGDTFFSWVWIFWVFQSCFHVRCIRYLIHTWEKWQSNYTL